MASNGGRTMPPRWVIWKGCQAVAHPSFIWRLANICREKGGGGGDHIDPQYARMSKMGGPLQPQIGGFPNTGRVLQKWGFSRAQFGVGGGVLKLCFACCTPTACAEASHLARPRKELAVSAAVASARRRTQTKVWMPVTFLEGGH